MFKFLKEKLKQWTEKISKAPEKTKEVKEDLEFKDLEEKSKKIKKEIHFEPSLDKQLRGETLGLDLEEENKKELPKSFFERVKQKAGKVKISEKEFDEYKDELEMLLLENNVAFEVSDRIIKELRKRIIGKEFLKKEIGGQIRETLKDIIAETLVEPFNLVDRIYEKKIRDLL